MLRHIASRYAGQLVHPASVETPALQAVVASWGRAGLSSDQEKKEEREAEGSSQQGSKHAGSDMPPGDTADVAPEFFDGNKDVAGVASGVSARPDRNHKRADGPSSWDPPKGSPSAPDFEKRLSRDPHEADIPDFPGLNPKNQAEADKKDPRLASTTAQEAKEPGNWPGTRSDADRNPGGDEDLPTPSAPSAEDQVTQSSPGPTGGRFVEGGDIRDEADPAGIKWGEKPRRPEGPTEHVG